MANIEKEREVAVKCLFCEERIVLWNLKAGVELKVMDAPNTVQEKTCPHCRMKGRYPADVWEEVEL